MAGVYKLEINESEAELKQLLGAQKSASDKERIHLLYLLKSQKAQTVQDAAGLLGRNRVTLQEWMSRYREGGLENLLRTKPRTGRPRAIPEWAARALENRLHEPEGFNSYGEICQWLETQLNIRATYSTVYKLVHERLKASPKVARPHSERQSESHKEAYKKKLGENLAMISWVAIAVMGLGSRVRFFCGDETRIGLKTVSGRKITSKGVKPIGKVQWKFQATYLYGIVEPKTGDHFFYEFTHLNTDCFQVFLNLVSQTYAEDILIIQLDNGAFHKAKRLEIPSNIILMFQPPYCPELNPIERVWQHFKRGLRWKLPKTLQELRDMMSQRLAQMTQSVIASLVGWQYILDALSVARI